MEPSFPAQRVAQAYLATRETILSPLHLFISSPLTTIISQALNSSLTPSATKDTTYTDLNNSHTASSPQSASAVTYLNETSTDEEMMNDVFDKNGSFLVANMICCLILITFELVQYLTFGALRCSEKQHLRETFWDYIIQKGIFIFFILDTKTYEERSAWAVWFATLGFVLLSSKLSKDRFEYLTSSPSTKSWPLIKISVLMSFLLLISLVCTIMIPLEELTTPILFQLADATYVLTFVLSVITRFIVLTYDMRPNSQLERSASINYYTDLIFSFSMLSIELLHNVHLTIVSHASVVIRIICLTRIHTLTTEITRRYRRHKHYLLVVQLMESSFANATQEEIEKFSDECAICWDEMDNARKLPCGHLFHNSCLRSWLEQDTSCPTCRTSFKAQHRQQQSEDDLNEFVADSESSSDSDLDTEVIARAHQRNHLFHFDSSRYTDHPLLRWLPGISIEGFI